ncbi:angiopoietin-related protein 7-like [Physella acuta]|uniref:angiopoietin-related protein 7-like n=1 Tax=Physella acuta TaxID=109671 RepID=UPI0027DD32D2|nr:angiopoietin-related protein 7-like [Physella acuta]
MASLLVTSVLAICFILCSGVKVDIRRESFHRGKNVFCAQLQCTENISENITEDTQMSALVNMSVYRTSESEGKILVASILGADSRVIDYKVPGVLIDGKMSKHDGELMLYLSNPPLCHTAIFKCEVYFSNMTGEVGVEEEKTESTTTKKKRKSDLVMSLKAKTIDYVRTVDTMADFLKSFEDPEKLKGADMSMSLQMSHSDGDEYMKDTILSTTDLTDSHKQIFFSNDMGSFNTRFNNLTTVVKENLQVMNNRMSSIEDSVLKFIAISEGNETSQLVGLSNKTGQDAILNTVAAEFKEQMQLMNDRFRNLEDKLNLAIKISESNQTSNLALIPNTDQKMKDVIISCPLVGTKEMCKRNYNTSLPNRYSILLNETKLTLCDTKTDLGGWILIQRRISGDVDFSRKWNDYKDGFGSIAGDFWLGNKWISWLTMEGFNEMRIDMSYNGSSYHIVYRHFTVQNEVGFYRMTYSTSSGNIVDNLSYHNGMKFATVDRDNNYCAASYTGGWWYDHCYSVVLNGIWGSVKKGLGIHWFNITGNTNSLDFVEMKVRKLRE